MQEATVILGSGRQSREGGESDGGESDRGDDEVKTTEVTTE